MNSSEGKELLEVANKMYDILFNKNFKSSSIDGGYWPELKSLRDEANKVLDKHNLKQKFKEELKQKIKEKEVELAQKQAELKDLKVQLERLNKPSPRYKPGDTVGVVYSRCTKTIARCTDKPYGYPRIHPPDSGCPGCLAVEWTDGGWDWEHSIKGLLDEK